MQSNEKIIMNLPTVFCHLAGSLTQSIRSNEPLLIFTRDEEIGSLQATPFHFSSVDLPVLKSTWKIGGWGQSKSRRAHESWEVSESNGQSGGKRGGEPNRNEQRATIKKPRGEEGAQQQCLYVYLLNATSADCFINTVSLDIRWRNCKQEDGWEIMLQEYQQVLWK